MYSSARGYLLLYYFKQNSSFLSMPVTDDGVSFLPFTKIPGGLTSNTVIFLPPIETPLLGDKDDIVQVLSHYVLYTFFQYGY